jgi:hypothetical protein
MKKILLALFLAVTATAADIQVFFSPNGGCTAAVVNNLDKATNSVLVQAYSFTSAPIAQALVDAHKRGVNVEVILDRSQRTEKYSAADFIQRAGIPTFIDAKSEHNVAAEPQEESNYQTKGAMQSFSVSKVSVEDALVSDTYRLSLDSMVSRSKTSACSHSKPFTRSGVAMLRVGSLRPRRRRVSRWR